MKSIGGPYVSSDTNIILNVLCNYKRNPVAHIVYDVLIGPRPLCTLRSASGFHHPRNFQRAHLLVPRVVQDSFSDLQCRSLRGFADRQVRLKISDSKTDIYPEIAFFSKKLKSPQGLFPREI